jgi:hypothetical protein
MSNIATSAERVNASVTCTRVAMEVANIDLLGISTRSGYEITLLRSI